MADDVVLNPAALDAAAKALRELFHPGSTVRPPVEGVPSVGVGWDELAPERRALWRQRAARVVGPALEAINNPVTPPDQGMAGGD